VRLVGYPAGAFFLPPVASVLREPQQPQPPGLLARWLVRLPLIAAEGFNRLI